jgi:serine/threonine protein kinase
MSPLQNPPPLPDPRPKSAEQRIDEYFSEGSSHDRYSDKEIEDVSELLRDTDHPSWHTVPRLCIVLRTIGKLELLDLLIEDKITDFWFPFPENASRHPVLSTPEFLSTQAIVLTEVTTLERGKHRHLGRDAEMPFKDVEDLGHGPYRVVQEVSSLIQGFARKTIWRRLSLLEQQENMTSFKQEVDAWRRLEHHHIVKLKGSYTDSVRAAFFMPPVADCNLAEYLLSTQKSTGSDSIGRRDSLRRFFGCLAHALAYAHQAKVRHKDNIPRNILVTALRFYLQILVYLGAGAACLEVQQ